VSGRLWKRAGRTRRCVRYPKHISLGQADLHLYGNSHDNSGVLAFTVLEFLRSGLPSGSGVKCWRTGPSRIASVIVVSS
jgi:hypothetical protein